MGVYDQPAARSVDVMVGYHGTYCKVETGWQHPNVITIDMKISFGGLLPVPLLAVSLLGTGVAPAAAQRFSDPDTLAPAYPTPQIVVDRMLSLAQVKPGETVYDLGCGDGRIVITAAQKFKARAVGIEIR